MSEAIPTKDRVPTRVKEVTQKFKACILTEVPSHSISTGYWENEGFTGTLLIIELDNTEIGVNTVSNLLKTFQINYPLITFRIQSDQDNDHTISVLISQTSNQLH